MQQDGLASGLIPPGNHSPCSLLRSLTKKCEHFFVSFTPPHPLLLCKSPGSTRRVGTIQEKYPSKDGYFSWWSHRESNPGCQDENLVSWPLDDGTIDDNSVIVAKIVGLGKPVTVVARQTHSGLRSAFWSVSGTRIHSPHLRLIQIPYCRHVPL